MTQITKNTLLILVMPFLMATCSAICMDKQPTDPAKKWLKLKPSNIIYGVIDQEDSTVNPQLRLHNQPPIKTINGTLLIDEKPFDAKGKSTPALYLPKSARTDSLSMHFKDLCLKTPFISVKIVDKLTNDTIEDYIPVNLLANCNNTSSLDLKGNNIKFHLQCSHNPILAFNKKYAPVQGKDQQRNDFETQYLSCMNYFYKKQTRIRVNNNEELIADDIIISHSDEQEHMFLALLFGMPINPSLIKGPNACSTEKDLINLTTAAQTKLHGNSAFNCITNRQNGKSAQKKVTPKSNAEIKALFDYYYELTINSFEKKSPTPKVIHFSKSPNTDIESKPLNFARDKDIPEMEYDQSCLELINHMRKKSPTPKAIYRFSKDKNTDIANKPFNSTRDKDIPEMEYDRSCRELNHMEKKSPTPKAIYRFSKDKNTDIANKPLNFARDKDPLVKIGNGLHGNECVIL